MTKLPDAWRQTHATTATKRAKALAKVCATEGCGARLQDRRKTYCGPCYDARLQANIAANRWRYSGKTKHYKKQD